MPFWRSRRCARPARLRARSSCRRLNFARPQFENKFPAGATASVAGIFERETGIKIKFVETDPATEYQTNIRNASTKNGSFDFVTGAIEDTGDYANAGLLRPLDDYVAKYRPSWNDPKYGYAGGRSTVQLFTQYDGQTYWVAFDNDTQPYVYRYDLFNDPKEKANFEDKYGQPLVVPEDVGRSGEDRRVLHAARTRRSRCTARSSARARSGARSTGSTGSSARADPNSTTSSRTARRTSTTRPVSAPQPSICGRCSGRSRATSPRTGSRSTRPSAPATVSRVARSRT